jgi:hypothetical protein
MFQSKSLCVKTQRLLYVGSGVSSANAAVARTVCEELVQDGASLAGPACGIANPRDSGAGEVAVSFWRQSKPQNLI